MTTTDSAAQGLRNHPLAFRMAAIAFINQNITIACIFGSFSVLLSSVEARLGVGREMSTLAMSALTLGVAICAPISGALATRGSLRLVLLAGSILCTLGFALLALTASFPLYIAAYGLLIGPGMAAGVILPAALVTRWYVVNRGRTLGIMSAPVVLVLTPLLTIKVLSTYGLSAAYLLLTALAAVNIVANLFIVDWPPGTDPAAGGIDAHGGPAADGAMTMPQLARNPVFWALLFAFIASGTGAVVLGAHIVPIAESWGLSATLAASLLSIQSFVAIAGTISFGWIADRLGGARALALLAINGAILWTLLLIKPPFAMASVIIGLIGLHCAGAVPALSVGLSERFGRESFSRAYGLANLLNLPFSVMCVPAAALVYSRTGSYAGAIIGIASFLGLAGLLALSAGRRVRAVTP